MRNIKLDENKSIQFHLVPPVFLSKMLKIVCPQCAFRIIYTKYLHRYKTEKQSAKRIKKNQKKTIALNMHNVQ